MYKLVLALAICGAAVGCTTPQARTAQAQECVTVPEEATGSRVESDTVCRPAETGDGAE